MNRLLSLFVVLTLVLAGRGPGAFAQDQETREQTVDSAIYLLRTSMQVRRDGRHNLMLRSLRHLADPQLKPLFAKLAESPHPTLKIHGILGLAECDAAKEIDLTRVAAISTPMSQAEIIGAALDSDLLSHEQAATVMDWKDIDLGVRMMVAARLVKADKFDKPELLEEAVQSDNIGRRGMAAVLMVQTGHPDGNKQLAALDESTDPRRDSVRFMLLDTILRYEFDKTGPWGAQISTETGVSSKLGMQGMRVALRFKVPEAANVWREQFNSATDPARQTRLALIALDMSSWIHPQMCEPLISSSDPLIKKIGAAARAVAAQQNVIENVGALIKENHSIANQWALAYVRNRASPEVATPLLKELVTAVDLKPHHNMAQRQDTAALATQILWDKYDEAAIPFFSELLANEQISQKSLEAVMLGMIRSKSYKMVPILTESSSLHPPAISALTLLLKARSGRPLTEAQLNDLGLLVRGGGSLPASLRLQAGWLYLKHTDQADKGLAQALSR